MVHLFGRCIRFMPPAYRLCVCVCVQFLVNMYPVDLWCCAMVHNIKETFSIPQRVSTNDPNTFLWVFSANNSRYGFAHFFRLADRPTKASIHPSASIIIYLNCQIFHITDSIAHTHTKWAIIKIKSYAVAKCLWIFFYSILLPNSQMIWYLLFSTIKIFYRLITRNSKFLFSFHIMSTEYISKSRISTHTHTLKHLLEKLAH